MIFILTSVVRKLKLFHFLNSWLFLFPILSISSLAETLWPEQKI